MYVCINIEGQSNTQKRNCCFSKNEEKNISIYLDGWGVLNYDLAVIELEYCELVCVCVRESVLAQVCVGVSFGYSCYLSCMCGTEHWLPGLMSALVSHWLQMLACDWSGV